MKRYCEDFIRQDLDKKMVFIGGPRQVGKTTISTNLYASFASHVYLNWDIDEDRKIILHKSWLSNVQLIIFDELHKYPRWKQWIKGVYDHSMVTDQRPHQHYLVTGSARLDLYKHGGDSLLGRYHYWRLHPLTLDELPPAMPVIEGYKRLLTLGGFPEPFLTNDEREARRWRHERFKKILTEDIRDIENIRNIQLLKLFIDILRSRVGGLITLSNIAQDLEISSKTAKSWLSLIEVMYIGFAIYPFTTNVPRAISKPPKFYFFDNADTNNDDGARLENLIATTLLKRLHLIEDYFGYTCSLHYLRDKDGREVDFVTVIDGVVDELIEVKTSNTAISTALKYYANRLRPKRTVQIVGDLQKSYEKDGVLVSNPIDYFTVHHSMTQLMDFLQKK